MKVVVTGATGFLGAALTQALLRQGAELHVVVRPDSARSRLHGLSLTVHEAEITQPETLTGLFAGADWVVHAAGILGQPGLSESDYQRINVLGTRHVLQAISDSGARPRVLHVSSAGVLGPLTPGAAAPDETAPLAPSNAYERSKADAEKVAAAFAADGLPVIIARPEFVYGPGDWHVLGLFQAIQQGRFFYIGGGHNTCHPTFIEDAVAGMLACLQRGEPGQAYHITGPRPVAFRELATTIAAALNVLPPRLSLPVWLAYSGALGLEIVGKITGRPVPLSRTGVAFFSENRRFSYAKAQRHLSYQPQVDLTAGITRTIAWYQQQGKLTP